MRLLMRMWFFITVILISNVKRSQGLCENDKKEVKCLSVGNISSSLLSQVSDINEVKSINIRFCPELEIFPRAFEPVVKLERVIINNNGINKIYSDTFKDLPLKYVNLGYNGLEYIQPGAFSNLYELDELRVDNNNLKHIPKGVFANLPLKELTLSKNNISTIEYMALENLEDLKKLKLDNNKLETIVVHQILTYPGHLKLLWLNNNLLKNVTSYMLQKMDKLKTLNLGHNFISIIEPISFQQTPKLIHLILSNNPLKQLDGNIFPKNGMALLETLYLDNNEFMFLPSNFFDALKSLKRVTLVGNPWTCPCLIELKKSLAAGNVTEICNEDYTGGSRPICVTPQDGDSECKYVYNSELCETYKTYKKDYPLYSSTLLCLGREF